MYPATIYKHNKCLNTYTQVQVVTAPTEDKAARRRIRAGKLDNLRSFVTFEIHYRDGRRDEIARGMAG
jgi:hypothetical protein